MQRNWVNKAAALCMALCMLISMGCAKQPEAPNAPLVLPTPTPQPQAKAGGTLRLPMPTNAEITDPFRVNTKEMLGFYSLLYESLVTLDATGQITACLAEHWSCNATGRVWTFSVRPAGWHDGGGQVAPADVMFSYERIKSLGAASYYSYNVAGIESMRVLSATTLEITMREPGIAWLYALTFPIVRRDFDITVTMRPVGTGPYMIESLGSQSVALRLNPGWWKQAPYIESIVYYERDNNDTALASYAAGQLDMAQTSNVSVGAYREEGVTRVQDMMTQTAELLIVNSSNTDLRDIRVRRALAYALDRSTIITNVYMNRAQVSDVPIAPDSWLYESRSKVYDHDEEQALALLAEAGWTDGDEDGVLDSAESYNTTFSLRLLVCRSSDTTRMTAADMIASQLEAIGIVVELVPADYTLGDDQCDFMVKLASGDFDLALMGVNVSRNADVRELVSTSGARNYGHYADAALDRLTQNVLNAQDEATYRSAASALQLQFVEELPFIVLYFRLSSLVYTAKLQGISDLREPQVFRSIEKWYMYTDQNA